MVLFMKKNKKLVIIIVVVLLILALGITAVCIFGNNNNKLKMNKDVLIGVFLTTDSVFESDYYAGLKTKDNKYYATLTKNNVGEETEKNSTYVFEGLNGYGFYNSFFELDIDTHSKSRCFDNAFCNQEISGDFTNCVMNAMVYVYGKEVSYCLNPVYQDSEGNVYMVLNGEGTRIQGPGITVTEPFYDSVWVIDDFQMEKLITEINIEVKRKNLVKETSFTHFTKDNEKIKTDTFKLGEVPKEYPLSEDVDYIIVDTVYTDTEGIEYTEKELVRIGEDELYLYTLDDDGIYSRVYL